MTSFGTQTQTRQLPKFGSGLGHNSGRVLPEYRMLVRAPRRRSKGRSFGRQCLAVLCFALHEQLSILSV